MTLSHINHIFDKLDYYGFHGVVIDWIISLRALNLLIIVVIIHLFVAFRVVFLKTLF